MRWLHRIRKAWQRYQAEQEREIQKLRRLYLESERLRAELSHLEREIYEIRDSKLPRRQKELLESTIRVRCRKVEHEMLRRQYEISASGHLLRLW